MSNLDSSHIMSDTMEVTEIDWLKIIIHAYSQVIVELDVPLDLAGDIVRGSLIKDLFQVTATKCGSAVKCIYAHQYVSNY